MARSTAVPLAPGVWRIPTAPFDGISTFVFVAADGQATLVDHAPPVTDHARERARERARRFLSAAGKA